MTSIDPTGKLLVYLREQAKAWQGKGTVGSAPQQQGKQGTASGTSKPEDRLAANIAAIARDDPQASRKAFRLFLESALISDLGPSLAYDPGFASMVDRVQSTMELDASLKPAVDEAGALLLARYLKC